MILKVKYIDHLTGKAYAPGDNVAHLPEDQQKFLKEGDHVEVKPETDKEPGKGKVKK